MNRGLNDSVARLQASYAQQAYDDAMHKKAIEEWMKLIKPAPTKPKGIRAWLRNAHDWLRAGSGNEQARIAERHMKEAKAQLDQAERDARIEVERSAFKTFDVEVRPTEQLRAWRWDWSDQENRWAAYDRLCKIVPKLSKAAASMNGDGVIDLLEPTGCYVVGQVRRGDWLIEWPDGRLYGVSDAQFNKRYRPVNPRHHLWEGEKWTDAELAEMRNAKAAEDCELTGAMLLLHEDDDGKVGGFCITGIAGGARYVFGTFDEGGFPQTINLQRLDEEGTGREATYECKQVKQPLAKVNK